MTATVMETVIGRRSITESVTKNAKATLTVILMAMIASVMKIICACTRKLMMTSASQIVK